MDDGYDSCQIMSDEDDDYVPLCGSYVISIPTPSPTGLSTLSSDSFSSVPSLGPFSVKNYSCVFCENHFATETDVHRHNLDMHPEIYSKYSFKRRKCKVCNRIFKSHSFQGLMAHMKKGNCSKRKADFPIHAPSLPSTVVRENQRFSPTTLTGPSFPISLNTELYGQPSVSPKVKSEVCQAFLCRSRDLNVQKYCKSCKVKRSTKTEVCPAPPKPKQTSKRVPLQPYTNKPPHSKKKNKESESVDVMFSSMVSGRSCAVKANMKNCPRIFKSAKRMEKQKQKKSQLKTSSRQRETSSFQEKTQSRNDTEEEIVESDVFLDRIQGRLCLKIKTRFWNHVAQYPNKYAK